MSKRSIEIKVRLNKKEMDSLSKRVKKSGLSREAYLRHLINGCVPRDAPPPDYGHNMKNGTMFSDLERYADETFYKEHKYIRFDTLSDYRTYEIFAVFRTTAYSDDGFKYYSFVDADDAEDFNNFIEKCKELSLYDTGVTAEYGDKLLTLSTCEYTRTNGRLVVIAKLVKDHG